MRLRLTGSDTFAESQWGVGPVEMRWPVSNERDRSDLPDRREEGFRRRGQAERPRFFEYPGQPLLMGEVGAWRKRKFLAAVIADANLRVLAVEVVEAADPQVVDRSTRLRGVAEQDQVEPAGPQTALPLVPGI